MIRMTHLKRLSVSVMLVVLANSLLLNAPRTHAAPWIEPGDLRMRHSLQVLSDNRALHSPLTTWPIMWGGIAEGLSESRRPAPAGSQELAYVQFERNYQTRSGFRTEVELNAARSVNMLRGFADQPREELQAGARVDWIGDRFAAALSYSYVDDPQDDEEHRFDGSYIAANAANWVLGAGYIDRWWGPGWQSSLILSSNARPVPSLWINRKTPSAPSWPWLRWIGPWQLTLIAGQLEEERRIPDARLLGARLTVMPLRGLEIGFVRTAQWGGKNRPENLRNLGKLIIGDSNQPGEEVGNQLGGVDFRYGFAAAGASFGIYGQVIGEDEAGYAPSKYMGLAGLDMATHWLGGSQRWFFEGTNTVAGRFVGRARYNVAYEHSQYRTGYNYRGRNIASTFGSDSEAYTLGLMHFFPRGHNAALTMTHANLLRNGHSVASNFQDPDIRPQISATNQSVFHTSARYEMPVFEGWLTLQVEYTDEPIVLPGSDTPSEWQLMASWRYRF